MSTPIAGQSYIVNANTKVSVNHLMSKGTFEFVNQEKDELKVLKGSFKTANNTLNIISYEIEGYPDKKIPPEIVEIMKNKFMLTVPEEFQE